MTREGDGGQALNQYLRRRKVWMALRDDAKRQGEQLTPYSFRHRYAKRMHAANIPIANISEAMGHTIEVHLKSYARFKPNATAGFIAAVNARLVSLIPPHANQGLCHEFPAEKNPVVRVA